MRHSYQFEHSNYIPHKFWILEFDLNVCLYASRKPADQFNKNDRAKRYNKSVIQNLKWSQKNSFEEQASQIQGGLSMGMSRIHKSLDSS